MRLIKLLPLVGIALFLVILSSLDLNTVLYTFLAIDPWLLLLAVSLQVPIIIIKGAKWKLLIRPFSVNMPLRSIVSAWIVGFSIGIVTPGRVGDLARAYYVKDHIGLGKSLTTVIIDRVIDIIVLFFLAILGIITFVMLFAAGFDSYAMVVVFSLFFAGFIAALFIASRKGLVQRILSPFHRRIVPMRYRKGIGKVFHDFYRGLGVMKGSKRSVAFSATLCLVSWLMIIVQNYLLSIAMGMELPLLFIASVIPVIILLDALPISFSGVGTRDAALIFLLGFMAIAPETAVAYSLLILVINYLVIAGIGFMLWLRNPIHFSSS